jgi:tetratricopeptide (TPR) repeat protein
MFVAEQLFGEGDFETALNGDGNNAGFVEIVENFGGTRPGRLAAHYAGICYLRSGDLDSALDYLQKYKPAKGAAAVIVNAQNLGLQGDIYVQKNDYAKAADMYRKAVAAADNVLTTPYFLKKSAEVEAVQGNTAAAIEAYRRIKNDYAGSLEARDIDKYIGALEQQ